MTAPSEGPAVPVAQKDRYLIRKGGVFYRPNAQGYTSSKAEAGRYTLAQAIWHSHPNGPDGPRDGIDFMLADEATLAREAELRKAVRYEIVNTPETADFMAGVPIEAMHQRERWAADHDAGKTPFDWFWLVGYLSQKAASSQVAGDIDKALHHTISTAAALANWHLSITGADTSMRPGIADPSAGLSARSAA